MASSAAAPPLGVHEASVAPIGDGTELRSALAAAESAVGALAVACVSPCAVAAPDDASALRRRMGALSAALDGARAALAAQQPVPSAGSGSFHERIDFSALPHSLFVCVLAALPADARLRCAEVCKFWAAAVSDRSLWLRVDLSPEGGVTRPVTDALLRAVAARAEGHMQALRLPLAHSFAEPALLEVLTANKATVQELSVAVSAVTTPRCYVFMLVPPVKRVLCALPRLRVFHADLSASVRDGARALLNEPPFQTLRVHAAQIQLGTHHNDAASDSEEEELPNAADMLALAAGIQAHASLNIVFLKRLPLDTPAALDAFIDAVMVRRFSQLVMNDCCLSPASASALARLLSGGALKCLTIDGDGTPLLDAPAAAILAGSLRANTTLRALVLENVGLWYNARAGADVIMALTAHPSLQELILNNNWPLSLEDAATVGAALGALVAVNAPALQRLCLAWCSLEDAGFAPLLHALPANTHLRELYCCDNDLSDDFARDNFLPAVQANCSLRKLVASEMWGGEQDGVAPDEVLRAEALVNARAKGEAVPVV